MLLAQLTDGGASLLLQAANLVCNTATVIALAYISAKWSRNGGGG